MKQHCNSYFTFLLRSICIYIYILDSLNVHSFSVHLVPPIVKSSLSFIHMYVCVYIFIGVLIDQSNFSDAFYWIVGSSSYAFLVFLFWVARTPMICLLLQVKQKNTCVQPRLVC